MRSALANPPGQGFVDKTRGLAADPELDDDEAGAFERPLSVLCHDEPARPFVLLEDPASESTDDFEPLIVDVVQDELVEGQAVTSRMEAFDQLWGVGAAAADDRDLYPHEVRAFGVSPWRLLQMTPTPRHRTREYAGIVRDVS